MLNKFTNRLTEQGEAYTIETFTEPEIEKIELTDVEITATVSGDSANKETEDGYMCIVE